jgi:hypothetical protein
MRKSRTDAELKAIMADLRVPKIKRLIAAATAFLQEETEIARISYQDHHPGVAGAPTWSDDVWRSADPAGARLAIELRRALKAIK